MIIRELPVTSPRHYLTGMTAINIPSPEGTGDWHFHDAFFGDRDTGPRYHVAGVDCVDTSDIFGDQGIYDSKLILTQYGVFRKKWEIQIKEPTGPVYAANHYRASADILADFLHAGDPVSMYSIDDWLSLPEEKARFWDFIQPAKILGDEKWQMITEWFNREMTIA